MEEVNRDAFDREAEDNDPSPGRNRRARLVLNHELGRQIALSGPDSAARPTAGGAATDALS